MPQVGSVGPLNAEVMIIGEAPGREEVLEGEPFVGLSGQELTRMLEEAGFDRKDCRISNVCGWRPPENDMSEWMSDNKKAPFADWKLLQGMWVHPLLFEGVINIKAEIEVVNPQLILCLGNTSLWAVTEKWGITSWRGSQLYANSRRILPTYHPAAILRQWSWRHIAVHDLKRARSWLDTNQQPPDWRFRIRPVVGEVLGIIQELLDRASSHPIWLAVDVETRDKRLGCIGISWSKFDALCIPLTTYSAGKFDSYWSFEEEVAIFHRLRTLLTNPNVFCIGQNFLYDAQYFARELGYVPNLKWDTMSTHHLIFLEQPKALHFIASMYCDWYAYWKDDGKLWDPTLSTMEQHWTYNCTDAVYTWEIAQVQRGLV